MVEDALQAVLGNPHSGAVTSIVAAVLRASRVEAEEKATAEKVAKAKAEARRIRGNSFKTMAEINGFVYVMGDAFPELVCLACSFFNKKRGQKVKDGGGGLVHVGWQGQERHNDHEGAG